MKYKNLCTVKENVYQLLRTYPYTRNNDNLLIILYWHHIDHIKPETNIELLSDHNYHLMNNITPASSIFRARQLIQNEDKDLPPTSTVAKNRRRKEDDIYNLCRQTKQSREELLEL